MSPAQSKGVQSAEEKRLNVVTFWLFVVAVFSWVITFAVLFVLGMVNQSLGQGSAFSFALLPSLIAFAVTAVLCVIVYVIYRKAILKM